MKHNDADRGIFDDLKKSLEEAVAIAKGELKPTRIYTIEPPDVKSIREKTGLSQSAFARMIRVNVKTLQNWEQHRRNPTGPAAALLTIVASEPDTVIRALHAEKAKDQKPGRKKALAA
jgi:putative transcriptional regulator